jgi:hypothetical protein
MMSGTLSSTVVSSNDFMAGAPGNSESNAAARFVSLGAGAVFALSGLLLDKTRWRDVLTSYACGLVLMVGLAVSGMTQRSKVLQFLNISPAWDPSLMFVMGVGVALLVPVFYWVKTRAGNPVLDTRGYCKQVEDCYVYKIPVIATIDSSLVVGGMLFGLGWGIAGLCPGPAVGLLALGHSKVAGAFFPALLVGMSAAMGLREGLDKRRSAAKNAAEAADAIGVGGEEQAMAEAGHNKTLLSV